MNATAEALPATSDNGIEGTWSPATIDTSVIGTTTYTFTPAATETCAEEIPIEITITNSIIPTFSFATEYCLNATAEALPATSDNGIEGTWSPATIDTSAIGTTTYTFTPVATETCAEEVSIEIIINQLTATDFAAYDSGDICDIADLPTIASLQTQDDNGVEGSWSQMDNENDTYTYTFDPDDDCFYSFNFTLNISQILPIFTFDTTYCINEIADILPSTSDNGITGSWSPIAINTAFEGVRTYKFTPDADQCAEEKDVSIAVSDCTINNNEVTIINVITPNGDGLNDVWRVDGIEEFPTATVEIYNRFNKLLYRGEGAENCIWDGKYLGRAVPSTDYWYVLNLGNGDVRTGHITVKNEE